ncbi:unnamed protein product [Peniophora sp. CBMAI 1063]|nr:unnamed protein product [Peniophora sp. CBMAI 1063]
MADGGALKELDKLCSLTAPDGKATSKSKPIDTTLDGLIATLSDYRARTAAGETVDLRQLPGVVERAKKDVDARQQEVYTALTRYGKAIDKKFAQPLPTEYGPLFASPEAHNALLRAISQHLLRTGRFSAAEKLDLECPDIAPLGDGLAPQFESLHAVLAALRAGDIGPALAWAHEADNAELTFRLHTFAYLQLLASPSGVLAARDYARTHLAPRHASNPGAVQRLLGCLVYAGRLEHSPYTDLAAAADPAGLEAAFAAAFAARLGMGARAPLAVAASIGGGGALARIEKGRKLMRERRSEWSQADELPIEVPLGPENRFHSVFACPVSKDQATEANPPMMLNCGHVVAKESLQKLGKANGKVKCPYCPQESYVKGATRMYF